MGHGMNYKSLCEPFLTSSLLPTGILVGLPAHSGGDGDRYEHLHQVLRHPHPLLQPKHAKEPPFHGNFKEASQILATTGKI